MDARTDHFFDFILKKERRRHFLFLIFEAHKLCLCKCALDLFFSYFVNHRNKWAKKSSFWKRA